MAPHDDDAYERVHMDDDHEAGRNSYGHANPFVHDEDDAPDRYGALPPRRHSNNAALYDHDVEYGSGIGNPGSSLSYNTQTTADHGYGSDEPAHFPDGNYDRVHR